MLGVARSGPSRDDQAVSTVGELTSIYLLDGASGRDIGALDVRP